MKKIVLLGCMAFALTITPLVYANEHELTDQEIDVRSNRLDVINDKLQQTMTNQDRADLLFEKSQLMFSTFGPMYLRTPTECLLEAIQLEPGKTQFRDYLKVVYDSFWKDRDFSGDDQISKDLTELKKRCKKIIDEVQGLDKANP